MPLQRPGHISSCLAVSLHLPCPWSFWACTPVVHFAHSRRCPDQDSRTHNKHLTSRRSSSITFPGRYTNCVVSQNQPGAGQQGLPPPNPIQHPRSAGLIQQHRPHSPHQSQPIHPHSQGPYISPHSSTHSLSQHQSPYVSSVPGVPQQHPGEANFFAAHPSPYSAHSAAGSYASSGEPRPIPQSAAARPPREASAPAMGGLYGLGLTGVSEPTDNMAAQAAISRQPYPPMQSSYQTPQSNSPASAIQSPQTDAHGRPVYAMPPMAQQMYYPQYQMPQQSPYAQHPPPSHHASMTSAPSMMVPHQQPPPAHQPPPHQSSHPPPNMMDTKPQPPSLQRPPSVVGGPDSGQNTPSGPGKHAIMSCYALLLTCSQLPVPFQQLHRSLCAKITTACIGSPSNTHAIASRWSIPSGATLNPST